MSIVQYFFAASRYPLHFIVKSMKNKDSINNDLKARLRENLEQTFKLIELHQGLKFSLYKKLYPRKSDDEVIALISHARLMRKHA